MAKRIMVNKRDVFCVEIEGKYKSYFQFMDRDINLLNSDFIRVFKTRYEMDYEPVLDEIIKDDVLFYSHTFIRVGLDYGAWYKVGHPRLKETFDFNVVRFGTVSDVKPVRTNGILELIPVDPLENWRTWYVNGECENGVNLANIDVNSLELGVAVPYKQILDRIKYGCFRSGNKEYDIIKRRPIEGVNSYIRHKVDGVDCYFHFIGEDIFREIIVTSQGAIRLTRETPQKDGYTFHARKFWEINWAYREYITETDFLTAWNES